jgi:hypothetical protein
MNEVIDKVDITPKMPFTQAYFCLIVAPQGGGKSTILTARPVDDTFKNLTSVIFYPNTPKQLSVKASPALNEKGHAINGWATLYFPNKEPLIMELPRNSCAVANGITVYANYHLYGVRAAFIDLAFIMEHADDGTFYEAWLNIDEGYIGGNARNSMSLLNQILTGELAFQLRKNRTKLQIAYPMDKMADSRIRMARSEYITCSYNEKSMEVIAEIKKDKIPAYTRPIDATQYWKYYKTEERFKMPEGKKHRAIASAM